MRKRLDTQGIARLTRADWNERSRDSATRSTTYRRPVVPGIWPGFAGINKYDADRDSRSRPQGLSDYRLQQTIRAEWIAVETSGVQALSATHQSGNSAASRAINKAVRKCRTRTSAH